jgi:hypothetical protein
LDGGGDLLGPAEVQTVDDRSAATDLDGGGKLLGPAEVQTVDDRSAATDLDGGGKLLHDAKIIEGVPSSQATSSKLKG